MDRAIHADSCDTESTDVPSEPSEAKADVTKPEQAVEMDDSQTGLQAECMPDILSSPTTSRHNETWNVQAWQAPPPPSLPASPCFFVQHTGQVVMSVATVLASSKLPPIDVHTTRDRKGWSIVAKLRPEHLGHTEDVLSWAKEAILQAALDSSCVYVMGHRETPFRARPHGFSAILGLMEDEQLACWDVYNTGCCKRELGCKWAHPASVKRLYFVVRPLVPDGIDPWECFKEIELPTDGHSTGSSGRGDTLP